MLEDRAVEAQHVRAALDHLAPPRLLDVALELDAERAVIESRAEAAIDIAGRKNEAAPFAQVDQLFHRDGAFDCGGCGGSIFSGQKEIPPLKSPISRSSEKGRRFSPTGLSRRKPRRRARSRESRRFPVRQPG